MIALCVSVIAGMFAEHQNRMVHDQSARARVNEQLGALRARLEMHINSNLQLVRGLVAVIATQPNLNQEQFSAMAANLLGEHSQLRNIAAAPGLVISLMHPMEGNEKAIGLNYRKSGAQWAAAEQAINSRQMVLAGPVDLLQGGQGFIGRFPVFVRDRDNRERLWGLVSAVVDVDKLYSASGLLDPELALDVALSGRDTDVSNPEVFFGTQAVLDSDPVQFEVSLPSGAWRLSAIPKGGWAPTPDGVWEIRLLVLLAALLVISPIAAAGYLYDQRRAHLRELNRRQQEMLKLSQRLNVALDTSRIAVWELNLDTSELRWDERMRELYGIDSSVETIEVDHWANAIHPNDKEQAIRDFEEAISADGTYHSEFRVRLPNGATRWIRTIGAVHDNIGGHRFIIGVNWDVSADIEMKTRLVDARQNAEWRNRQLEEARAQMEHNALHDALTGLPNRRFLDRLLDGREGCRPTALMHVDLDRFKQINDTLGHAAGDAMLIHAAGILKANMRDCDHVMRIGGDEFVIATMSSIVEADLAERAGRMVEEMRKPVPFQGHACRFGASIGIVMAGEDSEKEGSRLLVDADIALYRAKSEGRNRVEFFSSSLKTEVVRDKQVADEILNGLDRGEFLPYFQPQFDAQTLDITGVEALARWEHPEEGVLPPENFLRVADELNVVPMIDRTILEQALWQNTRWRAAGLNIPKMSVNISAGQLNDGELLDRLDKLNIEPGTLSFELLESIFLDDSNEIATQNIERIKALGIEIEIDDFGTGYASIISLLQLRPTRLKIDRRLIEPIVASSSQRRLVASIIEIGHSLDIKVVAEGVETRDHVDILRDLGCDTLQGFAFAPPMPAGRLMAFVQAERWRDVA
ncbi:bifunctional diguanylate cyclase/phosphodiesterase [Pseudohoeflea coraliihabitans]|uniref:bifunctional diguanylate cyclase/phosphodiesterase n=1 Tax=Pseudohoeflea coraliihabitans TaxID=2860393 RepID=UPI003204F973